MSIENFNLSSPYFSYPSMNASIAIIEDTGVEKIIGTMNKEIDWVDNEFIKPVVY